MKIPNPKTVILFACSVTPATFYLITVRAIVSCVDGADEKRWGFPFYWIKSGPNSLSFQANLLTMITDFALYLAFWMFIFSIISCFKSRVLLESRKLLLVLWVFSICFSGVYLIGLSLGDLSFNYQDCDRIKTVNYFIDFGFPRQFGS